MKCIDRYEQYKDDDFDIVILKLRNGSIKAGRYANLVKVDKDAKIKGKTFFDKGGRNDE